MKDFYSCFSLTFTPAEKHSIAPNTNIWHEPTTDPNPHQGPDSHIMDDVFVNHFQIPRPEEEERERRVIPSAFDKRVKSLWTILEEP